MPTILDQYREKQSALRVQLSEKKLTLDGLLPLQELNYRVSVLETFQAFCQSAPITQDTRVMGYHFQLVDAAMRFALAERKFGAKTDAAGQQKRQTAHAALERIVQNGKKRFSSFAADTPEQYRASVYGYINTVLPVWVQYRDTYIHL